MFELTAGRFSLCFFPSERLQKTNECEKLRKARPITRRHLRLIPKNLKSSPFRYRTMAVFRSISNMRFYEFMDQTKRGLLPHLPSCCMDTDAIYWTVNNMRVAIFSSKEFASTIRQCSPTDKLSRWASLTSVNDSACRVVRTHFFSMVCILNATAIHSCSA